MFVPVALVKNSAGTVRPPVEEAMWKNRFVELATAAKILDVVAFVENILLEVNPVPEALLNEKVDVANRLFTVNPVPLAIEKIRLPVNVGEASGAYGESAADVM